MYDGACPSHHTDEMHIGIRNDDPALVRIGFSSRTNLMLTQDRIHISFCLLGLVAAVSDYFKVSLGLVASIGRPAHQCFPHGSSDVIEWSL